MSASPSASNHPPTEAAPGLVLASGRYQLLKPLGAGGFGRVWKARDTSLDVDVAIKEVYVPPGTTPAETAERVERAAREARSAARMRDHPNIVTVHDVVVERGVPWTVMQFVPGRSLDDEIKQGGPVIVPLVEKVAAAMLAALDACHRAGIVHRDVKPANIMLTQDGTVLLTDFGIAKQAGHAPLTAPDLVIASVEYIAPERARGLPAIPASDLFSLGVTLYHAVEGISPFDRGSGMASLSAVLLDELPESANAGGNLARAIRGLTQKNPGERMTADEAVRTLGSNASEPQEIQLSSAQQKRMQQQRLAQLMWNLVQRRSAEVATAQQRRIVHPGVEQGAGKPVQKAQAISGRGWVGIVAALAVLLGAGLMWGRSVDNAKENSCVNHSFGDEGGWNYDASCAVPMPFAANYQVMYASSDALDSVKCEELARSGEAAEWNPNMDIVVNGIKGENGKNLSMCLWPLK